jgi:hypothetical protein
MARSTLPSFADLLIVRYGAAFALGLLVGRYALPARTATTPALPAGTPPASGFIGTDGRYRR